MSRLASIAETRFGFYECLDNEDFENAADWFETLYLHYQRRGKKKVRS